METVSFLLENKANINQPNKTGRTALMRGLLFSNLSKNLKEIIILKRLNMEMKILFHYYLKIKLKLIIKMKIILLHYI